MKICQCERNCLLNIEKNSLLWLQAMLLLDPLIMDFSLWDQTRNTYRIKSSPGSLDIKQGIHNILLFPFWSLTPLKVHNSHCICMIGGNFTHFYLLWTFHLHYQVTSFELNFILPLDLQKPSVKISIVLTKEFAYVVRKAKSWKV